MPRYYFHTQTDLRITDEDGVHLDDDPSARREAIRAAGEMVRDCPEVFWNSRPWSVIVTDTAGRILYEITMNGVATAVADT